ncbi:MAG: tRNA uridine-5-carboxymethylaminomethyl(34) synthesis enzyme MnmG, partial [Clostridia bacterium]|nr:tRNA uridine-5-carboxymethylaminomethyl(34) synthesis enzyme MnmG [Clostridia bacterium]
KRRDLKEKEIKRVNTTFLAPSKELNELLERLGTAPLTTGVRLADLIKRPQVKYCDLAPFDKERPSLPFAVCEKVETEIKYEGYILRQNAQIAEMLRLENKKIPEDIDYDKIYGLRLEAKEKLNKVRPASIGQASRISGVSPADISVLLINLKTE